MTYVDDLLVAGSSTVVQAVMKKVRATWTTSEPDQVAEVPIKFLGVEISKAYDQAKGRDIWYMSQSSYTKDLLAQGGQEVQERKNQSPEIRASFQRKKAMSPQNSSKQLEKLLVRCYGW